MGNVQSLTLKSRYEDIKALGSRELGRVTWTAGIGLCLLPFVLGAGTCGYDFHYLSSDPEKVKAFLVEQNIYCPGDDKATILAMIDWSRRNMAHIDGKMPDSGYKSMLGLIDESRQAGRLERSERR